MQNLIYRVRVSDPFTVALFLHCTHGREISLWAMQYADTGNYFLLKVGSR
jgi:hypothetical protein